MANLRAEDFLNVLIVGPRGYSGYSVQTKDPCFYYFHEACMESAMVSEYVYVHPPFDSTMNSMSKFRDVLSALASSGRFDVLIHIPSEDEIPVCLLKSLRTHLSTICFSADDEWRWDDFSSERVAGYDYFFTLSDHVFDLYKSEYKNLRLSQWAMSTFFKTDKIEKDVDLSFVGWCGPDVKKKNAKLEEVRNILNFGLGSGNGEYFYRNVLNRAPTWKIKLVMSPIVRLIQRLPSTLQNQLFPQFDMVDFQTACHIWDRSRSTICYSHSTHGQLMQIKSRLFDVAGHNCLLLAENSPYLSRYFSNDEIVVFDDVKDLSKDILDFGKSDSDALIAMLRRHFERCNEEHRWVHRLDAMLSLV